MADWKNETIPLAHPIKVGELSITEIVLREPDLDALEAIEALDFGNIPLIGPDGLQMRNELGQLLVKAPTIKQLRGVMKALSGQPDEILGKLHRDDFESITEKAVPLLEKPAESPPPPGSKAVSTK